MLMTTISPWPFLVKKTGSELSWTVLDISAKWLRRSDTGLILGMFFPPDVD